jgi:glycosyl transferase family 2
MPLFSTIIPTFNRRDLLRRTLATVLSPAAAEPQIIVVDDGSTDGTLEMLEAMAPRVRTLRQSNRGPGAARNLGLTAAEGEYVAFLDSDDLWFPWTLDAYRNVIETFGRPAFIAGRPLRFKDEAQLAEARPGEMRAEAFADYYASGDQWRWWGVSSFVIRRDALTEAGGFTDGAVNGEDADLAMKLGVAPGFVQVTEPFTFGYREHAANLTKDMTKYDEGLNLLIDQERGGRYPGGRQRRWERLRILSRHTRAGCLQLLAAGAVRQAWNVYRKTFPWNAGQLRLRFLAATPMLIAARSLKAK